jgi:two-component system phosphate regulon response regulator PhoB
MLASHFEVISAENAVTGIDFARNRSPDVILMEWILPVLSGEDACSLMRKDERIKKTPIIAMSSQYSPAQSARGAELGVDDFIAKPFDFKELLAKLKNRLTKGPEALAVITVGDLSIHPATREVSFGGKAAKLTLTEFDLIRCLAVHSGSVVSRDKILEEVWRESSQSNKSDRTIDVHVRALRKKIPALTRHIISIYGVGYKYEP